jgi:hypothetical protein
MFDLPEYRRCAENQRLQVVEKPETIRTSQFFGQLALRSIRSASVLQHRPKTTRRQPHGGASGHTSSPFEYRVKGQFVNLKATFDISQTRAILCCLILNQDDRVIGVCDYTKLQVSLRPGI